MIDRKGVTLRPDWREYRERDDQLAQFIRSAVVVARQAGCGSKAEPLDRFIPPEWRADEFGRVLRAAIAPLMSETAPVLSTVAQQFLRALTPLSAGAAILESGIQVKFDGAGSIGFPSLVAPSGLPSFISPGAPIPVWNLASAAGAVLSPCVFAAMCGATSEMLHSAQAEELIRQALLDATAAALDAAIFSDAAEVVGTSPAGLRDGLTPLTASAAPAPGDALVDDIGALVNAVAPVVGNSPVALVSARARPPRSNSGS